MSVRKTIPDYGGVWELVKEEEEYSHSSARYYATGVQGEYDVTSYTELEDIDLIKK